MLPHQEFLLKALQESMISTVVQALGAVYLSEVAKDNINCSMEDFDKALKISSILDKAAEEIANLGPKVRIKR